MIRVLVIGSAAATSLAWLFLSLRRRTVKLTDVEKTALGVCVGRMMASDALTRMEGQLWDDRYDKAIVGFVSKEDEEEWTTRFKEPWQRPVVGGGGSQETSWESLVSARTAFIDKTTVDFVVGQDVKQVVIVGAGLCCRAWRLPWPEGVTVWEVDSGGVERLKRQALKGMPMRAARRIFVKQDLAEHGLSKALSAAGHNRRIKTLWIAEGLIGYLQIEPGDTLMREMLNSSSRGSGLVMTCPPTTYERNAAILRGKPLHHVTYQEPEETSERLTRAGWSVHMRTGESIALDFGLPNSHRVQTIMIADKLD
jgi:methyltransferase (TIGR00027 family)